jgi:nicotinamidase-related amidase
MPQAPRRALIVIDVQNEYVTGGLRIVWPPVDDALANIGRAIDAARDAVIPVVVVQNRTPPGAPIFAKGSPGWELHPVVSSRPFELRIEKTLPSAFTETGLEEWLRSREVDTLTIVGFMTHNCDASTIIDGVHRGFACEFLSDATGSVPYRNSAGQVSAQEIHRVYSVVLQSRFAAVAPTDRWIDAVARGERLERGNILASYQEGLGAQR